MQTPNTGTAPDGTAPDSNQAQAKPSYQELKKQAEELLAAAEEARKAELAGAIKEIKEKMLALGITAADLGFSSGTDKKTKTSKTVGEVAYRHTSGATWTGRGRRPQWIIDAAATPAGIEQFKV